MPGGPFRISFRHFWYGCGALGIGAVLALVLSSGWLGLRLFQLEWAPQGETELTFEPVALDFQNRTDLTEKTGSLPFMAGIVIDLDADGRDEIVLGAGRGQADGVFALAPEFKSMTDLSASHALDKGADDATMGGTSTDIDSDGLPDLLLARESGVWLFRNSGGSFSRGERVFVPPDSDRTTIISISPGDINGDGHADLYLSGYIHNSDVEGQTIFTRAYGGYAYLLIGDGKGAFADATSEWGLRRQHNTFTAVFADIDRDGLADLVAAQDTGVVETWRNAGAPPLESIANPSVYSYPMGIAAGDYNNDGHLDFYFSNVGHTLPEVLVRGDLPGSARFNPAYMLFAGDGEGGFEDVAASMKAARLGFGWGAVTADFNLDGLEDIAIAQNYAKFGQPALIHRYAGKLLLNIAGNHFVPVEKRAGVANRLFAITPLAADLDADGRPDLVWVNLNGPARVFLNRLPDARSVTLRFDDSPSAYGAVIEAGVSGRQIVRQVVPGQGLASDSSANLIIGLGEARQIDGLRVTFSDGRVQSFDTVTAGQVLDLRRDIGP
ncbi:MAG: hypothetical protein CVT79_05855 [Alphaproteobacteria bacterium HGW-Alphaproteobacteria-18]|nr:MAG: hypothetical protein CVT79_05855 [Alphaproteobacteria bacterium HGW-Alphaproteobacteria-18]